MSGHTHEPAKSVRPAAPEEAVQGETLEAFKASFAYGSRADLLFKFIKNLDDADAAEFLRGLLEKLGDTINDGELERIYEHLYGWIERAYLHEQHDRWHYEDGPFAPLSKPLSQCRLGLLTASGHFAQGDDPQPFGLRDMTQADAIRRIKDFVKAEPILSTIPMDIARDRLRVRHPGYDIRGVLADFNVAFPLDRLAECAGEGLIGELLPDAFSFVGATAQLPLLKKHAPAWVDMLKARQVDAMLLVPV